MSMQLKDISEASEMARILMETSTGLSFLHSEEGSANAVIHRDVKR